MYFPVSFSRYDPALLLDLAAHLNATRKDMYALSLRFAVKKKEIKQLTGAWRSTGYGMVCAAPQELISAGSYNESNLQWGLEDIHMFQQLSAPPRTRHVWRMHDPLLQHE